MESKLQAKIIDWLKANGVYVIKTRVLPGVPVGCPDIIGLYKDRWLVIEVKSSPTAKYRQNQAETLQKMREGGNRFVYRIDPEDWEEQKRVIATAFL